MATGAPKTSCSFQERAKEKAISNACNLLSGVMDAIKSLMTPNCPLLTVTLNKKTAVITIQQMGNKPYNAPFVLERRASFTGMPYTKTEMTIAISVAIKLAWYPFIFFRINAQKIKTIGTTATIADKAMLPRGSISCVQFMKLFSRKFFVCGAYHDQM